MIPDGWRECSFAEVAKIDVASDLKESSFSPDITNSHTYPVYSNTVQNRGLYGYYDFQEYDKDSLTVVGRGIGLGTAFSRTEGFGAIGRLLVLSPKNNAFNTHYLADYINFCIRIHFENGAIPQLPGSTFGNYRATLPPLHEQNKIAEILSTWDRAIVAQEQLIANARAQKKALMQLLLTPKKRLPGFKGEWKRVLLSELAVIVMGSSPSSTAYNTSGLGMPLIQGNADIAQRKTAPRMFTADITQTCELGDIIFSVRAPVGEISTAIHEACIGRGVAAIRPRLPRDRTFLYYLLLAAEDGWANLSQGSTFLAINSKELKNFQIFVPTSFDEREAIGTIIQDADESENNLTQQLVQRLEEKSALMQQLLTGKRRVKHEEKTA